MKKILLSLTALLFVSQTAMAGIKGGCVGSHRGHKIIFMGLMTSNTNTDTAEGYITVDGRRVADFEGEQLRINYLFQTFKVTNNRGDLAEGRVNNLFRQTGVLKRLYVRGFGIDYRNIPMSCWTK